MPDSFRTSPLPGFSIILFLMLVMTCGFVLQGRAQIRIDGTFVLRKKPASELMRGESPTLPPTSDPELSQFRTFDAPPKPLNLDSVNTWIGYPSSALEAGLEGKVIAEVLVSPQGKYVKHTFKSSSNALFSSAVEKKIRFLRFSPALKDNTPVKAWASVPFRFKLHN